jgi:predicted small metal-binding protein
LHAALKDEAVSEDEVVANIIGAPSVDELTEVQQKYKDKIKAQIARVTTPAVAQHCSSVMETLIPLLAQFASRMLYSLKRSRLLGLY